MSRERIHSFTGVLPLGAYLVLHLFEASAAVDGRRAFEGAMSGVGGGGAMLLEGLLVLLPLAVHVVLGISIWARPAAKDAPSPHQAWGAESGQQAPRTAAFRTIQRVTGVLVLIFLAVHLGHTFLLEADGADAGVLYDRLRADLGTPLYMGVYVIGTAAVALHLANGLPAAARRFSLVKTDVGHRNARVASAALALVLFAMTVNTMSHFVVGDAFYGTDVEAQR